MASPSTQPHHSSMPFSPCFTASTSAAPRPVHLEPTCGDSTTSGHWGMGLDEAPVYLFLITFPPSNGLPRSLLSAAARTLSALTPGHTLAAPLPPPHIPRTRIMASTRVLLITPVPGRDRAGCHTHSPKATVPGKTVSSQGNLS